MILLEQLLEKTVRDSWNMIGKPKRVLAAFSGGADSTALLFLLNKIRISENRFFELYAIHINHGLRESASFDADWTKSFCNSLNIPYICINLALPSASEEVARNARYKAIIRHAEEISADTIALAHHKNDQAETFLMKLIRGSLDGLSGMRELTFRRDLKTSVTLWRPLLGTDPIRLRELLKNIGLNWCEDNTNSENRYLRNRVRNQIIPLLKNENPSAIDHILEASDYIRDIQEYLDISAESWLENNACMEPPCFFIESTGFDLLPSAVRQNNLRYFLKKIDFCLNLPYSATNQMLNMKQGDQINLPKGWHMFKSDRYYHVLPPEDKTCTFSGLRIVPSKSVHSFFPSSSHIQWIPKSLYEQSYLRAWETGDYIRPFGMSGNKKLQDYFTDLKIAKPFRKHIPLLCVGHEVLWAVGIGISEKLRIGNDNKDKILLQYPIRIAIEKYYNSSVDFEEDLIHEQ